MSLTGFNKNSCINVSVPFSSADRMRLIDFGFNDKDINNIDRIIEAIHELVSIHIHKLFVHSRIQIKYLTM